MKLKDYPEYKNLVRYVQTRSGIKRFDGEVNPYSLRGKDELFNGSYWSLILTEDHQIYLMCNTDNSLRINTPDELLDEDRIVPYEFIPETAFNHYFERFSEYQFGTPKEIIHLIDLLRDDYPKYKRIAKLNSVL